MSPGVVFQVNVDVTEGETRLEDGVSLSPVLSLFKKQEILVCKGVESEDVDKCRKFHMLFFFRKLREALEKVLPHCEHVRFLKCREGAAVSNVQHWLGE